MLKFNSVEKTDKTESENAFWVVIIHRREFIDVLLWRFVKQFNFKHIYTTIQGEQIGCNMTDRQSKKSKKKLFQLC